MSLIRLLAAGSSLSGVKDRLSPYKMTEQNLLPKFGMEKPAETKSILAVPPVVAEAHFQTTTPIAVEEPVAGKHTADLPESGTRSEMVTAESTKAQNERTQMFVAEAEINNGPVLRRAPRLGLFRRWTSSEPPFRHATQKAPVPTQGELRLESIKVVRNDLHDTDLEVVTASKQSNQTETVDKPPMPHGGRDDGSSTAPKTSKLAWRQVAARLFGARKS